MRYYGEKTLREPKLERLLSVVSLRRPWFLMQDWSVYINDVAEPDVLYSDSSSRGRIERHFCKQKRNEKVSANVKKKKAKMSQSEQMKQRMTG